jgi:hypothetical protein
MGQHQHLHALRKMSPFLWSSLIFSLSFVDYAAEGLSLPPFAAKSNNLLTSNQSSRRSFLQKTGEKLSIAAPALLTSTLLLPSQQALAIGEGSERMVFRRAPSAPLGALLPAVQQRLLLEAVRELANKLSGKNDDSLTQVRQQIESILLRLPDDGSISKNPKNQDYKVMKQYSPSKVISGTLVRAAMNIYTSNLNYGNIATSTAKNNPNEVYEVKDPSWKKEYIRANDGLPSVDKVIAADLDLRDLYRNQVQQKLDDASAEWYSGSCDLQEFQSLLSDAATAFDSWLDRISEKDVKDAIQAVLEGKELQLYQSYSAGFVPTSSTSLSTTR